MSADVLAAELAGGILTLTLDRPEKRNALNEALIDALHGQIDRADVDAEVRVVVVRGAGKDFCAGADLAELLASADQSPEENAHGAMHLGELFVKMRSLPKPVVAVVQGRALAGGCGLATACDLVIAHAESRFGYPEIRRGFVPAMVMAMLRRAVTEKVAFDLVGTGRVLTAQEALAIGLVSRVVAPDRFADEATKIAVGLAGASGTALALIKRQLYAIDGLGFEEAIRLGAQVNATARATPDFKAAVRQFLDKK